MQMESAKQVSENAQTEEQLYNALTVDDAMQKAGARARAHLLICVQRSAHGT